MELKQMKYFRTIVEEGTISSAAVKLHMAQPPLSMQLKQLEEELGTTLLIRGRKRAELTAAGRLFYKRCIQMISLSELTTHEVKDVAKETLRLGVTSSNSSLIQQPFIQRFFSQRSQLNIRVKEGTTYDMIDLLLAHNIDLAIVRTPFDSREIQALYLEREPMYAVGSRDFLNERMIEIKDYQDAPLILHKRYVSLVTDYCLKLQFNPYIRVHCDDCRTSLVWASCMQGVAIVPKSALPLIKDTSLLRVELKDKELYTGIAFIIRRNEEPLPIMQEFINLFK